MIMSRQASRLAGDSGTVAPDPAVTSCHRGGQHRDPA